MMTARSGASVSPIRAPLPPASKRKREERKQVLEEKKEDKKKKGRLIDLLFGVQREHQQPSPVGGQVKPPWRTRVFSSDPQMGDRSGQGHDPTTSTPQRIARISSQGNESFRGTRETQIKTSTCADLHGFQGRGTGIVFPFLVERAMMTEPAKAGQSGQAQRAPRETTRTTL